MTDTTPAPATTSAETPKKVDPSEDDNPTAGQGNRTATLAGLAVWVFVGLIVVGVLAWNQIDSAKISLDVSPGSPFTAKGSVVFQGERLTNGLVHLVVSHAKDNRYLGSLSVSVDEKTGTFSGSGPGLLPDTASRDQPLKVTARFQGLSKEKKALSGSAIQYINFAPPLGGLAMWATIATMSTVAIVLITLFTGELTRRKARFLFGMTYLMTFLSLALPIALTVLVSRNVYMVEMMEAAPIGLVKGTAKGVDTPQWLLNIGGAVTIAKPASTATVSQPAASVVPSKPPTEAADAGQPTPTAPGADDRTSRTAALGREAPLVVGGLAVPFYVVFLAMLGAGINMTIQVPKIQNRYDVLELPPPSMSMLEAALQAPLAMFADRKPATPAQSEVKSGIRRELIGNYMYLLSAPFLAIAVYYFLQIVATNTAEPVLVLMAFATGLVSDRIILRITRFAEETLGSDAAEAAAQAQTSAKEAEAKAREAAAKANEAKAKVDEAEAKTKS